MKELISFSLLRRFKNRSTIAFNIILFIGLMAIFFADGLINIINPQMLKQEIIITKNISNDLQEYLNNNANEDYIFKSGNKKTSYYLNNGNKILELKNNKYILHSNYEINQTVISTFELYLSQYEKNRILEESDNVDLLIKFNEQISITNKVKINEVDISEEKSNIIFMFVTSIYFMMLSFVSAVASEVVNEKSTRTLELVLTSISAKAHFISKMVVGWLVVVIQSSLSISYFIFWLIIRTIYDGCSGLISCINRLHIISISDDNIYQIINNLDLTYDLIIRIMFIVLFLMVGILIVQLVLTIVSSFVVSIEEAGNIQAPFYLMLLAIYYLSLSLNNPFDLSEGLGRLFSFIPIFNMLFMPCRILVINVPIIELIISFSMSVILIILVVVKGSKLYEKGVLDYSGKGLLEIIRSIR